MPALIVRRRARLVCIVLWTLAWIGIAALMLLPLAAPAAARADLVGHFLLFGGMALGALSFSQRPGQLGALALLTIAGGSSLETAQALVPHRFFDPLDALANAAGALTGCAAALLILDTRIRTAAPARHPNVTGS